MPAISARLWILQSRSTFARMASSARRTPPGIGRAVDGVLGCAAIINKSKYLNCDFVEPCEPSSRCHNGQLLQFHRPPIEGRSSSYLTLNATLRHRAFVWARAIVAYNKPPIRTPTCSGITMRDLKISLRVHTARSKAEALEAIVSPLIPRRPPCQQTSSGPRLVVIRYTSCSLPIAVARVGT